MDEIANLSEPIREMFRKLITENKYLRGENKQLQKKIRELSFLYEMEEMLYENSQSNLFYQGILQMAIKFTDSEVGGIFLINPTTQSLVLRSWLGDLDSRVLDWLAEIPNGIKRILVHGKIQELSYRDPFFQEFKRLDSLIKSVVFFPLIFHRETIGLGFLMHKHQGFSAHKANYGEDLKFLNLLAQQASLIGELNRLKSGHQSQQLYFKTITALTEAIDAKDMYTAGHSQRVAEISTTIAYQLGLTAKEIDTVHYGSLLHDIGKIGIPESILNKKGGLTDEELFNIKRHPVIGTNILRSIDFLDDALYIVRYHHERFDGQGYPEGIKGEEIPFMARIVCIADAWDAMTSDRSYREALPVSVAIEELEKNKGSQFDPYIINRLQKSSFTGLRKI